MSVWLLAVLLATAVALLGQPGRRPRANGALGSAAAGTGTGARSAHRPQRSRGGPVQAGDRAGARQRSAARGRGRRQDGAAGLPLGAALVEVAARLRTGMDLPHAWRATLAGQPGAPATLAELAASLPAGPRADAVAGARAAVVVAERLGAPVADVLECCAQGLAEAEEGAGQRRTAMAAPRATARLLAWLPLAGLGLGVLLGAEPLAVFTDGGAGTASLLLGLLLLLLGRRWSALLVHHAQRAGA